MSVNNFKLLLVNAITIDKFVNYNNGNLVQLFKSAESKDSTDSNDINIDKYNNSFIYKNIDVDNVDHVNILRTIANSYRNFIDFINSDQTIDYTYLWDIICKPDKDLFPEGINLIIFELTNDDITNNVKIICPTNHYSNHFFDINKRTVLLLKQDKYYEPIYAIEDTKIKYNITKLLNLKSKTLLPELKMILNKIKDSLTDKCLPKSSIPTIDFQKNIILDNVLNILLNLKYEILFQVVNYQNKIIGVIVDKSENNDIVGFIPVYPSAINSAYDIPIKYMDDVEWNNYTDTIKLLESIWNKSNNRIICKPHVKIIEKDLLVGILTNANQFVQLKEPEMDVYNDSLEKINDTNYLLVDKKIQIADSDSVDISRNTFINNITLETDFYNFFRNMIRNALSNNENTDEKQSIQDILEDNSILYLDKLQKIDKILRDLTSESIIFSEIDKSTLLHIDKLSQCNKNSSTECKSNSFCMLGEENQCLQIIPKTNLINGLNNEEIYYAKIADELIRYNRLKSFILEPENYLTLSKIDYNLTDNEILILQSLITQEYFENLISVEKNSFVNNTTFDTVNPDKTKVYSSQAEIDTTVLEIDDDIEKMIEISDTGCNVTKKQLIGYLQELFPPKSFELYYKTHKSICSYEIFFNIMRDYKPSEQTNIDNIKQKLPEIYDEYRDQLREILLLLIELNKKIIIEKVLDKQIDLNDLLLGDEYYLTYVDMILIAKYYNLPIVLISSMPINNKANDDTFIIPNKIKSDKWYFIKIPSVVTRVKKNDFPVYKLITYNNKLSISLSDVSEKLRKDILEQLADPTDILTLYLEHSKPKKKYKLKVIEKVVPVKQKLKIVE